MGPPSDAAPAARSTCWDDGTRRRPPSRPRSRAVPSGRDERDSSATLATLAVARGRGDRVESLLAEAGDLIEASPAQDETRRWLVAAKVESLLWRDRPLEALGELASVADASRDGSTSVVDSRSVPDASIPRLTAIAARTCADVALWERAGGVEAPVAPAMRARTRLSLSRIGRVKALVAGWPDELASARADLARSDGRRAAGQVAAWRTAVVAAAGRRPYAEAYARWRLAEALLAQRRDRPRRSPSFASGRSSRAGSGPTPSTTLWSCWPAGPGSTSNDLRGARAPR